MKFTLSSNVLNLDSEFKSMVKRSFRHNTKTKMTDEQFTEFTESFIRELIENLSTVTSEDEIGETIGDMFDDLIDYDDDE